MDEWSQLLRLFAAVVAGSIIGFERELHDKPAGFRTNILICLGAAVFTLLSERLVGESFADRTRIAAQIVTGVGFLGAGTIIHFKGIVHGLTTAATIWTVASVGMAFGAGEYLVGATATALTTVVLFGLAYAESAMARWRVTARYKIKLDGAHDAAEQIHDLVVDAGVDVRSWTVTKFDKGLTVRLALTASAERLDRIQTELIEHDRVLSIKRV